MLSVVVYSVPDNQTHLTLQNMF